MNLQELCGNLMGGGLLYQGHYNLQKMMMQQQDLSSQQSLEYYEYACNSAINCENEKLKFESKKMKYISDYCGNSYDYILEQLLDAGSFLDILSDYFRDECVSELNCELRHRHERDIGEGFAKYIKEFNKISQKLKETLTVHEYENTKYKHMKTTLKEYEENIHRPSADDFLKENMTEQAIQDRIRFRIENTKTDGLKNIIFGRL